MRKRLLLEREQVRAGVPLRPGHVGRVLGAIAVWVAAATAVTVLTAVSPAGQGQAGVVVAAPAGVAGTVRAQDGKPLAGATVSARRDAQTFTTSVYTDDKGEFVFPALGSGHYSVWAQATGFSVAKTELVKEERPPHALVLTLAPLEAFQPQLTGVEWLDALPDDTAAHRRMKQILRVNCSDCHSLAVVLQNRFDEQGWRAVIRSMDESFFNGWRGPRDLPTDDLGIRNNIIRHHRDELAKYLAEMRGPGESPMRFAPLPRPIGEAARAVVTEYDVPIGERPNELAWHNGSIWEDGPAVGMHGTVGLHDVHVDVAGNAWITESRESFETTRSLVKLDPSSGRMTAIKLVGPDGKMLFVEQNGFDAAGNIWMHQNRGPGLVRLDPRNETFTLFLQPKAMGGLNNSTDADSKGRVWINGMYGSVRFDPTSGHWELFQQKSPGNGITYGMTVDHDDNAWWSQFYNDKVDRFDAKTNQVTEFEIRDPQYDARFSLTTPEDRAFYDSIGMGSWGGGPVVYGTAPRRLAADKNGTAVWIPAWAAQTLVGIDTKTLKVTYRPLPIHGHPYKTIVDKAHNVWVDVPLGDSVLKFNPTNGQWTVFRLPSHGCGSRHMGFDDARNEAWLPCDQSSKVARFQFRSASDVEAQKAAALSGR